jgi:hypothetical protein
MLGDRMVLLSDASDTDRAVLPSYQGSKEQPWIQIADVFFTFRGGYSFYPNAAEFRVIEDALFAYEGLR